MSSDDLIPQLAAVIRGLRLKDTVSATDYVIDILLILVIFR